MIKHVVLKKEMVIQERNSVNLTYLTMSKDPDLTMRVELHVLHARIQKVFIRGGPTPTFFSSTARSAKSYCSYHCRTHSRSVYFTLG